MRSYKVRKFIKLLIFDTFITFTTLINLNNFANLIRVTYFSYPENFGHAGDALQRLEQAVLHHGDHAVSRPRRACRIR